MYLDADDVRSVKVLVVGPFGVGKTTYIGNISEIEPLQTEEEITEASVGYDDGRTGNRCRRESSTCAPG
ncbi:hypothetical protein ACWDRX_14425, partial [Streptomyces nigra]